MHYKKFCFAITALLVVSNDVYGKKIKKNKRQKNQEDSTTIQPNVVAYSSYGFNDVGSYDGFVPTSPEYSSFLSGVNQESSTRLYAPAFPSAADSTGFGGNYGSQSFDGQTYGVNEEGAGQSGMSQYSPNSMNYMASSTFHTTGEQNKNIDSEDNINQKAEETDSPVYGTKINNENSRHKSKDIFQISTSDFGTNNNGFQNPSDDKYSNMHDANADHMQESKPTISESQINYQSSYSPSYSHQDVEDFEKLNKHPSFNTVLNFPRVVDFTNLSNKYYPTELDTSKLTSDSMKHSNQQMSMVHSQIDSSFANTYNNNKFADGSPTSFGKYHNLKNNEEPPENNIFKSNSYFDQEYSNKHSFSHHKHNEPTTKKPELKKKIKQKTRISGNYSQAFKDWKDASASSSSSVKGYGYATNYSNMNFKYDVSEPKKPFNQDEIIPASSNLDFSSYQYPEKDYGNFKKLPDFNNEDEYPSESFYKEKFKSNDYLNQFKNSFTTVPTTTVSYWGNVFKTADYSSFGDHPKKSHYGENSHDDVVNIPKRPHKIGFIKNTQIRNTQIDWPPSHFKSHKLNKPIHDWTKDFLDTRYKSEEDLLGLRTHDTSHPSYLPTFKPSNNVVDNDNEFKQLVEKWKQSYIKTKYKDVPVREYEGYGSEVKPFHVPVPKPYPVAVPVEKPYPVHIPYVRPVFHHTKPVHEDVDEDDYPRRPEVKKPSQYKKRPVYGSRNRTRRPSRASYQDRNRRRWPERRRPSSYHSDYRHSSRPNGYQQSPPYRHHDFDHEVDEDEHDGFAAYCRKTGNC
ncbi:uncharacterized protein LOC142973048 isoform X2 [Anticarsia gemmatalis]|uniref:uncharacterized protein LOC142973048 isoform X2 n=1 Tax=Anticarsia gemmatalis TaxID=129554 RepID=UPI003F773F1B